MNSVRIVIHAFAHRLNASADENLPLELISNSLEATDIGGQNSITIAGTDGSYAPPTHGVSLRYWGFDGSHRGIRSSIKKLKAYHLQKETII